MQNRNGESTKSFQRHMDNPPVPLISSLSDFDSRKKALQLSRTHRYSKSENPLQPIRHPFPFSIYRPPFAPRGKSSRTRNLESTSDRTRGSDPSFVHGRQIRIWVFRVTALVFLPLISGYSITGLLQYPAKKNSCGIGMQRLGGGAHYIRRPIITANTDLRGG